MMRKIALVAVLVILMSSLFFIQPTHAEVNGGGGSSQPSPKAPGTIWLKDKDGLSITFVQNDAYESGVLNYPYEYQSSVWGNINNQRVTIKFVINNNFDDWQIIHVTDSDLPQASLIQYSSWYNENVTGGVEKANTSWINPYTHNWTGAIENYPLTCYFTFLTNSSSFKPGIFEIKVRIHYDYWYLFHHYNEYRTVAEIWGEYTYGHLTFNITRPDVNNATTKTTLNLHIRDGKYHVQFWYLGPDGNWDVSGGSVTGPNVKLMQDYGYYTKESENKTLTYTFGEQNPTGFYTWLVDSVSQDGTQILYSWSPVVYNNASTISPNGTYKYKAPEIKVSFIGNPIINHDLTLKIYAKAYNSSTVNVWILAYYSSVLDMVPDPATSLVQIYMKPLTIQSGNSTEVTVKLQHGGQFNVQVFAKDPTTHMMNSTKNYVEVQDFTGGGDYQNNQPNWFQWPWKSAANIVILLVGVIFMFSRRPFLQIIGILLFFASFVNWSYVGEYLKSQLNIRHILFTIWRWKL